MQLRLTGRNGEAVTIPHGSIGLQGRDGRMVAVPKGAIAIEGRDGRMVAVPCPRAYESQREARRF